MKFFAVQAKFQVARAKRQPRVAEWLPRPAIPNDDLACAVLLIGNFALERRVRNRVIFDGNGHAFVFRIKARPFRHRPTF